MAQFSSRPDMLNALALGGQSLLDGVTVNFGPRRTLGLFFLQAEALAHQAGVSIMIHADLSNLVAVNAVLQQSWGPLVPIFDPKQSGATTDTSFWLSAHDHTGQIVATQAARRIDLPDRSLAEEFRSLRIFYADPAPQLAGGTTCFVDGECETIAESIRGRVLYSGAAWCRPDYRSRGLVYVLARVGRHLAMTRWDTDFTITTLRTDLKAKGILERYGMVNQAPRIGLRNSYRGDFDLQLVWADRVSMEAELHTYVSDRAGNAALGADADETNAAVELDQGRRSRS